MTFDECVLKYPIGTKLNAWTHQEKVVEYYMNDQDLKYWRNYAARYGDFTVETDCTCSYIKTVEHFNLVEGYIVSKNEQGFLECVPACTTWDGWLPIEVKKDAE